MTKGIPIFIRLTRGFHLNLRQLVLYLKLSPFYSREISFSWNVPQPSIMKVFLTTVLVGLIASISSVKAAARGKHDGPYDGKRVHHHRGTESRDAYSSNDVEARDTREDYYGTDHYGKGERGPYNDDPQQDNVSPLPHKLPNITLKPALQPKGEPRNTCKSFSLYLSR